LFGSVADVRRITQGPLGQRLLGSLGRHGLRGLGYFDNGFKQMSANRPLLAPADFAGLRMRVQASQVIAAQMRALGAQPVSLPFSETRRALAAGVVDGTENPVSNFWTQGIHAVQSDLSLTEHGYLGYAVVANQRFWRSLQPADRALLSAALGEALAYGNQIADAQNAHALTALRAVGATRIHTLSAAQRTRLRQAVEPVHQGLARRIGAPWMDALHAALSQQSWG
jgi:C4-dicarboxylate-binding protein DctP